MLNFADILLLPLYLLMLIIFFGSLVGSILLSVFSLKTFKKSKYKKPILYTSIISLVLTLLAIFSYALWRPLYLPFLFWISLGVSILGLFSSLISKLLPREKSEKVTKS